MIIYYLPIENNIFDGLYQKIIDIDNDILDFNCKYFNRDVYIQCFLKMLDDVYENDKNSIYYTHYKLSNSIHSFYRTIIKPMFDCNITCDGSSQMIFDSYMKKNNFFTSYSNDSWMDNIFQEELLMRYFLENEKNNKYLTEYGMFEISTDKTITPISFPFRDQITNDIFI